MAKLYCIFMNQVSGSWCHVIKFQRKLERCDLVLYSRISLDTDK